MAGKGTWPAQQGHARDIAGLRGLNWLKWLTILLPALAVFFFETVRHGFLEDYLPSSYGNVVVGLVALVLAFLFSEIVFRIIRRLHDRAVAEQQRSASLAALVQERERLSRELHDGLAQLVAYLSLRVDTVIELIRSNQDPEALAELERLRAVADEIYTDIRESITGLRARVSDRGLMGALADYGDEFEERHGIAVTLDSDSQPAGLPPLTELHLFRIVQEALTNVRKHAQAANASISLQRPTPDAFELVVADDGVGFNRAERTADGDTLGLASMEERAKDLGGTFHVEGAPGQGCRVVVRVPVNGSGK
jgi:signal transduction histidine kinase